MTTGQIYDQKREFLGNDQPINLPRLKFFQMFLFLLLWRLPQVNRNNQNLWSSLNVGIFHQTWRATQFSHSLEGGDELRAESSLQSLNICWCGAVAPPWIQIVSSSGSWYWDSIQMKILIDDGHWLALAVFMGNKQEGES